MPGAEVATKIPSQANHATKQDFDVATGLCISRESYDQASRSIVRAVELLERGLVDRFPGEAQPRLIGIAGSFGHGRPRIGLWSDDIDYFEAEKLQRGSTRKCPSDVDVVIERAQSDGTKSPKQDCSDYEARVGQLLMEIFTQTRVLLSWKPHLEVQFISVREFWNKI